MDKIGIVIVTYNRLKKLKKTLTAFENQTYKAHRVIIVNNNSSDGTKEYLDQYIRSRKDCQVVHLKENSGGSGGFAEGFRLAISLDVDWIFVSDDDAYPQDDCLEQLMKYVIVEENSVNIECVALSTKIVTSNVLDTWHRRRLKRRFGIFLTEEKVSENEYSAPFSFDILSYVGSMIKKTTILKAGITRADFFIAYDDSEHSIRLRKFGKFVCIPDAVMVHDTSLIDEYNWKKYYGLRNKLYSYKIHFCFFDAIILSLYHFFKSVSDKNKFKIVCNAVWDAYSFKLGKNPKYAPS